MKKICDKNALASRNLYEQEQEMRFRAGVAEFTDIDFGPPAKTAPPCATAKERMPDPFRIMLAGGERWWLGEDRWGNEIDDKTPDCVYNRVTPKPEVRLRLRLLLRDSISLR